MPRSDLILGASIIGPGADEIINMFAAYMYGGLPCKNYRKINAGSPYHLRIDAVGIRYVEANKLITWT